MFLNLYVRAHPGHDQDVQSDIWKSKVVEIKCAYTVDHVIVSLLRLPKIFTSLISQEFVGCLKCG